ncbi:right-handed parallel beta-helix repeat-containing protein [Occultella kanbiaonis]|uniref:right-handed parallel beta-helix repeat-containing protein n=1 Tax=Occultella kanbiaonis TaxID=2675754 RepID=UPI0013CFB8BA|nr:right-handed parallel beta-helix repeat-containing protein [Occultella kanbiaonis]
MDLTRTTGRRRPGPIRTLAIALSAVLAGTVATALPAVAEVAPAHHEVVSVTASGSDGNLPENAVDGDPTTRWSAQTIDGGEPQWLTIDLGAAHQVGYLGIAWHQGDQRESYFDIEVSVDGQTWTAAATGGASSGASLNFEPVELGVAPETGLAARYLRYVGHGNSASGWNSVTELRAYLPNPDGAVVDDLSDLLPGPDPDAEPWTAPGLVTPDGTPHEVAEPAPATGATLDVRDYGADPSPDTGDDAVALRAAIAAAAPGDTVLLPPGTYDLVSTDPADPTTHVVLRSGVHLIGSGADVTILRSALTEETSAGKVLRGYGIHDVVISGLTITSTFDGPFSDDPNDNTIGGGPTYGIYLAHQGPNGSERVLVENVTVERFQRIAIRIERSRDVIVRGSHFANATSVGGGGAGYGIAIQGAPGEDRYAYADDSRHNLITGNTFDGTYLRHAILLQYYTHNNLISGNTITGGVLDAIDLHGEDEYLNEIGRNTVTGGRAAGIALGNTGGGATQHDASGPGNWVHHNILRGNREAVIVMLGSPTTLIEHNVIVAGQFAPARSGIELRNAPGTVVRANIITGNRAEGFWGIRLVPDPGDDGHAAGDPTDVLIEANVVTGNANGVRIDAGTGIELRVNVIAGNRGEDLLIADGAEVIGG